MSTKISWTDETWNPVSGCTKVSAGCKNCYAETMFNRFGKRPFTEVRCHPERLDVPLHWKKPRKVFVNSMSDLFHSLVDEEFNLKVFDIMRQCDRHIFQILTKRPERMKKILSEIQFDNIAGLYYEDKGLNRQGNPRCFTPVMKNIWLGVSVEDQKTAGERIPILLQTPAHIRWLSVEPMLEAINLTNIGKYKGNEHSVWNTLTGEATNSLHDTIEPNGNYKINWVVVGCESGHKRRECKIEWIESIVEQCQNAGVPVWVKQIQVNGKVLRHIEDFPINLQVQEFPINK